MPHSQKYPHPTPQTRKQKLRQKARATFFERVSINGFVELYDAWNATIRYMWIIAHLSALGSIVYHTVLLVQLHLNRSISYEFIQTNNKTIPFPKVTVCAPTGVNTSWASDHIKLPPKERAMYDRLSEAEKDRFMNDVAGLIGRGIEFVVDKSISANHPMYPTYYHILTETGKALDGGIEGAYFNGALPSCDKVVSNCVHNGQKFDCCKNVNIQLDNYGCCFDLKVDKLDQATRPKHQDPPITFTFDVQMDWNYMWKDASLNGFFVYLDNALGSVLGSPITVPAGMHVIIDLSQPTWRQDITDCIDTPMPDTNFGPYDEKGYNCIGEQYMTKLVLGPLGCQFSFGSFMPNESVRCPGSMLMPLKMFYTQGVGKNPTAIAYDQKYRQTVLDIFSRSTACKPLCKAWVLKPRFSYSELMDGNYESPDTTSGNSANISRSKVTVQLTTAYYIDRFENEYDGFYPTFLRIAEVVQLYIGSSVITLAEIVYYAVHVADVYRRTRGVRNAVASAPATAAAGAVGIFVE